MKTILSYGFKILFGILIMIGYFDCAYAQSNTCAGATPLTSSTYCVNVAGTMKDATSSLIGSFCGTNSSSPDVWYSFTANSARPTITVSSIGSDLQANGLRIQLFNTGCPVSAADAASKYITCSPTLSGSTATLNLLNDFTGLTNGDTYWIRITTDKFYTPPSSGNKNNFNICITDPVYKIDYAKAYVNITAGSTGGTINPGDILEIRGTFVIGGVNTPISNIRYNDTLKANAGLRYVNNSIATRTNEGKIVNTFTDLQDTDAGWVIKPAVTGDTSIQINIGPGATSNAATGGGALNSNSRPSVYGGTCIIMATYRVTVTGAYGTKINFGGGTLGYTIDGQPVTITFPNDSLIVYPTQEACSDAVSPGNLIGSANNGTFGTLPLGSMPTAALQNAGPASFNTSYIYSNFSTGTPQDYYYGIANNTSGLNTIDRTYAKGTSAGSGNPRVFTHWDITGDHTNAADINKGNPPCDVTKPVSTTNPCGYLLAINSAYRTDKVFEYTASGVCTDTYYEVSAWFKNICYRCGCDSTGKGSGSAGYIPTAAGDSSGVRPNVSMQIDGINYYSTGELVYQGLGGTQRGSDTLNNWVRRSFVFKTSSTQTSFTITFKNNAPGGGGNDWAIDDIGLRTCYPDMIYAPPNPIVYVGQALTITDTVRSYFNNYTFYKWQKAPGATPTVFSDIAGASGNATNIYKPLINQYEFVIAYTIPGTQTQPVNTGDVYRMVVASNISNLNNGCNYVPTINFTLLPVNARCLDEATNFAQAPKTGKINWNKLNWSLGHIPTCCESAHIRYTGDNTSADDVLISITNDICIINLTLENTSTKGNQIFRTVLTPGFNMLMRGDVRMGAPSSVASDTCIFLAQGNGTITVNGNTIIGYPNDAANSLIGTAPNTNNYAKYYLRGDSLAFNTRALTNHKFTSITLDPLSKVVKFVNNTNTFTSATAVTFDSLIIGKLNPVSITSSGTNFNSFVNDNNGGVVISAGSSMTLPANYSINAKDFANANVFKSTFTLKPNALLFLGGISGGVSGSNFPANFTTYTLEPTSTVTYNGANQTLAGTGDDVSLYGNITITGSGIKKGSPTNVNLAGNLYRQGGGHTFDGNGGRVTFTSSTIAQKYYADIATTPMNFYDITNNNTSGNGLFLDSTIGVVNELELKTGTTITLRTGDIIMRSSSARTSHVANLGLVLPTIAYPNTWRFIIERYLYGQKSWRFLATPLLLVGNDAGTPTVAQAWRENKNPLSANGYGTAITGPTGPYGATGEFDYYTQRGSLKYYNAINDVFTEVTNNTTTTSLPNLTGYMVFVRGDRGAPNDPYGAGTATTLRMKGKIRTGDQSFPVPGNKYQSIGNPYASQINFAGTTKSNIANAFFVWNPILSGLYSVGGYENYVFNGSDYWLNGVVGGKKRNTIESGEAFFVQNNVATEGSLIIKEASKGTAFIAASRSVLNEEGYATIDVTLQEKDNNGDYITHDGVSTSFDNNFSKKLDNDDVTKFTNSYDNLFIQSNNKVLVVERRPVLNETDTIHLGITGTRNADYRLHISPYLFTNSSLDGYVNDKFLNTQTFFKLTDSANVDFKITSDAASRAIDRFMVVFKPIPLPEFTKISAIRINSNNARINWEVEKERNVESYIIERSTDSINFSAAGKQNATLNDGSKIDYLGGDTKAVKAKTWYRVKIIIKAGVILYSPLAMIKEYLDPKIFVSPNPVVEGKVNLFFHNQLPGTYLIKITNQAGQTVKMKTTFINSYTEKQVIDLGNVAAGVYQVQVTGNGTETSTSSIIVK